MRAATVARLQSRAMVLNAIWVAFILVGFAVALVKLFQGDVLVFSKILTGLFDTAKTGFDISLGLVGVMSLWLGIMKIGERAGMIALFARALDPLFRRVFPDIPRGHPASSRRAVDLARSLERGHIVENYRKVNCICRYGINTADSRMAPPSMR